MMKITNSLLKAATALFVVTASFVLGIQASNAQEKKLNVYNWSDYIAEGTKSDFEKATGIAVQYDTYDTIEVLHAKLVAGKSGYDIVVPSTSWAQRQIPAGLYQKLDKSQIPNFKNIEPNILAKMAIADPGNEYLAPWAWGVTTLGINVDKVKKALGSTPMPEEIWDLLFKPEYVSKLKSCGVSVLDSPDDVYPAALNYLGYKIDSVNPNEYQAAHEILQKIRSSVTLFSSSGYINDLATGSTCLALGWSGDFSIARHRATAAKNGVNIEMLLSPKGGELWFGVMAIPVDAPHPENAMKWINNALDPKVAASLTNKLFYPTGVAGASNYFSPEVQNIPSVFIPKDKLQQFKVSQGVPNDIRRLRTRLWTKFKSGI